MPRRRRTSLGLLALVGMLLAGCGSSGSTDRPTSTPLATVAEGGVVGETPIGGLPSGIGLFVATPEAPVGPVEPLPSAQTAQIGTTAVTPGSTIPQGAADADGDGFYTFAELQQAVGTLLGQYRFPPGFTVTTESVTSGFARYATADTPSRWEVGYEYTLLALSFNCAWTRTWLDAFFVSDTTQMDTSLTQLREELDNPALTDSRADLESFYQLAELGDPSIMQGIVANCTWSPFTATPEPVQASIATTPVAVHPEGDPGWAVSRSAMTAVRAAWVAGRRDV